MATFNFANIATIGFIIFFITTIVFIFLYVDSQNNKVSPENCPKIISTYSVVPNVDIADTKPLYICTPNPTGAKGTSECNFNGVNNLSQAIEYCNRYGTNCGGFSYNPTIGNMILINADYAFASTSKIASTNVDVYLRQANT